MASEPWNWSLAGAQTLQDSNSEAHQSGPGVTREDAWRELRLGFEGLTVGSWSLEKMQPLLGTLPRVKEESDKCSDFSFPPSLWSPFIASNWLSLAFWPGSLGQVVDRDQPPSDRESVREGWNWIWGWRGVNDFLDLKRLALCFEGGSPLPRDTVMVLQDSWWSLRGLSIPVVSEIFCSGCGNCQPPAMVTVAGLASHMHPVQSNYHRHPLGFTKCLSISHFIFKTIQWITWWKGQWLWGTKRLGKLPKFKQLIDGRLKFELQSESKFGSFTYRLLFIRPNAHWILEFWNFSHDISSFLTGSYYYSPSFLHENTEV